MIAIHETMHERADWRGVWQILRYNRGMYFAATVVLAIGAGWISRVPQEVQYVIAPACVLTLFWSLSSLWASHLVYDRTLPQRWRWIVEQGPPSVRRWLQLHAGVDETQGVLHRLLSGEGTVFDFFDPIEMTEPSIRRARTIQRGPAALPADYRALPLATECVDVVYLVFAAHELRRAESRDQLFCELTRVLRPRGRVIMLEHARSIAGAIVFGPGVLHFFSRQEWLRAARAEGLRFVSRTPVSPFADTFVWEKPS